MQLVVNKRTGQCFPSTVVKGAGPNGMILLTTAPDDAIREFLEQHPGQNLDDLLTWAVPSLDEAEAILRAPRLQAVIQDGQVVGVQVDPAWQPQAPPVDPLAELLAKVDDIQARLDKLDAIEGRLAKLDAIEASLAKVQLQTTALTAEAMAAEAVGAQPASETP